MGLQSVSFHYMFTNTLFFFSILAVLLLPIAGSSMDTHNDREALLAFKDKVVLDPFGSLKSWNSSVPLCHWNGVTCGHRHRTRVVKLSLRHQSLTGSLSPYIGNLSFLKILDLANNSFSQNIPPQLCYLTRLRQLRLQNNSFEGGIPANISAISGLVWFTAHYNKISGILPPQLGSLSMLQVLSFGYNNLKGGIPVSYGNLSSLQQLFIDTNSLSGEIPSALGKLRKLQILDVLYNNFSGIVPSSLFNISSLMVLHLGMNQLSGTLPRDLGTALPNLVFLDIDDNHFSGSLPVSLSNMSSLGLLAIGNNKFTGEVPNLSNLLDLYCLDLRDNQLNRGKVNGLRFISSLTNATELIELDLQNNGFVGRFSDYSFQNLSKKLQIFSVSGNKIYGNIPAWISSFVNLTRLDLSGNQFSGMLPQEIGKLQAMQYLNFSQNYISGSIPSSISNLTGLAELYLKENNLVGKIPSSLGRCQNLLYLYLDGNSLSGFIPREVFDVSSLVILRLSNNNLNGELPEDVGNLKNLVALNISGNRLRGNIPRTLGSCIMLKKLSIEGNLFQGSIPSTFIALKSLEFLDLSNNNLSGQIPKFLSEFNLKLLNLSFNDLEGAIPEGGVFRNLTAVSIANNPKVCGGLPTLQLPKCNSNKKHSMKFVSRATFKLVSSLVLGLLGLVVVLALVLTFRRKRNSTILNTKTNPIQLRPISYQELLKATNGFSKSNLIGVGSYGSVYKGIVDDNVHSVVAVKVLNLSQHGAFKSFMAECDVLRNIRHRNLVKLLTACSGVDYNCNEFKALIYEFMVNGNLDEWLHQNPQEDNISRRLSFSQRLNIAIDVANALDYLHNGCETSTIHCDLKPSNILLDSELVAHVGDFGLATSLPSETISSVKGSIGYTAPEYGMGSKPSVHGDVYSFGILLLEMFTGKRPTNDMFRDLTDLHYHVKNALPDKVVEVVDPFLLEDVEPEEIRADTQENVRFTREAEKKIEGLVSIFIMGVSCSSYCVNERQNMKDVVRKLNSIRNVFTV